MNLFTIAKVAVENTAYSFDMLFDYSVPDFLISSVKPGVRVFVPFGNGSKKRIGMVFSVRKEKEISPKLKNISGVLDLEPLLTEEMLLSANFVREQTFCTYFDACKQFLPIGYSTKITVSYAADPDYNGSFLDETEKAVYDFLLDKNRFLKDETVIRECKLQKNADILDKMFVTGKLLRNTESKRKVNDAILKMVKLKSVDSDVQQFKLTKKQENVIKVLEEFQTLSVKELCYFAGVSATVITGLEAKGVIEVYDHEVYRSVKYQAEDKHNQDILLSEEQNTAFEGIKELYYSDKAEGALLFGVTGSGKTQVYLKLIDEALKSNRGVIVMIPEISLTPQIISLFYNRYPDIVAVFHSALSLGERLDEWKRVKRGEAKIAVGTRSAVFAPFDDIGLIIIDEEQEHTYKSEMTPRYSAKDVAAYRIGKHKGLLLLSSATPSFDSYTKAQMGVYSLFTLKNRYGNAVLPIVEAIDTTYNSDMATDNISNRLADALKENFENGKQSILLLNRRGYNTFAACSECGTVATCPNCSISLTYHIKNGRLMCHYCGYSVPFTKKCSNCGNDTLNFKGSGTQRLEEQLAEIVPSARVLRMDADTTVSRYSYEDKFKRFGNNEYDILIGTQMVAKGLDFPDVTLVGVLCIDQMLYNDDYKSGERAFDLVTQVVGRSGRGESPGKAFIQTDFTENEIIDFAKSQDYESFYNVELPVRKQLVYPPFCDICVVGFSGESESLTMKSAYKFLNNLKDLHSEKYADQNIIVLGPAIPKIAKINGKYRVRILIKCKNTKRMREMLSILLKDFLKNNKEITVFADMNPEDII